MRDSNDIEVNAKTIGKAAVWSYAAELLAKIIVPISNMILARLLTPEAYGVVATINMIVAFSDVISTASISKYIVQHDFITKEEIEHSANVAFWTIVVLSLALWGVLAIFRYRVCAMIGCEGYEDALVVAALSIPLSSLSCIQEAVFQRRLDYKIIFIRRIVVSLLPFFVTIPLAIVGFGYWALILGTIASNVLKIILMTIACPWRPRLYYSIVLLKIMVPFCTWMLLGSIAAWGISYIDVFVVNINLGEYYTGLYKTAQTTVAGILSIVSSAMSSIIFSSLSRKQENEDEFRGLLLSFQRYMSVLLLPLGVGIFCFSDFVTRVLLGSQWMEASYYIGIWGFFYAFSMIFTDFCRDAYRAKGLPKVAFYASMLYLIALIPICILSSRQGFTCLATIRSVSLLLYVAIHLVAIKITLNFSPILMFTNIRIPFICALIMGVIAKVLLYCGSGDYCAQMLYVVICIVAYFFMLSRFSEYRILLINALNRINVWIKNR